MYRTSLLSFLSASILFVMLAAPSTAAALEKQFVRYDFVDGTSESERVNFVDEKFNDYDSANLDGLIFAGVQSGVIIIEGGDPLVAEKINELKNDSRLTGVRSVDQKNPGSETLNDLRSHTEFDPRGYADVEIEDHTKRVYLRVEFAPGADAKDTMDEYFDNMASESIGGTLVQGPGTHFMPTVLEGYKPDVDGWIEMMRHDDRFETVTVVDSSTNLTPVYPNLWSHSSSDTRNTTK